MSRALEAVGWTATTVGEPGAPKSGSSDEDNCRWCKDNGAVLVTHDRGKGNKIILANLEQYQVGAIIVLANLRQQPPRFLARALLCAEGNIDAIMDGRRTLRHHLRPTGKLDPVMKKRR